MNRKTDFLGKRRAWRPISASLLGACMSWTLFGCGGVQVPQVSVQEEQPHTGPTDYDFLGGFPDIMRFEQGIERSYEILQHVKVPKPGRAVVTIRPMPEGAVYKDGAFTWTPPCDAEDGFYRENTGFYMDGTGELDIIVKVKSDIDEVQYAERKAVLFVYQFKVYDDRPCGFVYEDQSKDESE